MAKKAAKKTAKKRAAKKSGQSLGRSTTPARKAISSGDLQHRLDALLHTMRCITQHEDELCTLLHDARRTGRISAPLLRELRSVLQELPAMEYLDDLYAVQQAVAAA